MRYAFIEKEHNFGLWARCKHYFTRVPKGMAGIVEILGCRYSDITITVVIVKVKKIWLLGPKSQKIELSDKFHPSTWVGFIYFPIDFSIGTSLFFKLNFKMHY